MFGSSSECAGDADEKNSTIAAATARRVARVRNCFAARRLSRKGETNEANGSLEWAFVVIVSDPVSIRVLSICYDLTGAIRTYLESARALPEVEVWEMNELISAARASALL